jgi:Beta-propeller domains of methanol dehydrogenase type
MTLYGSYVSNPDKVFSSAEETAINAKIVKIEKSTTAEIAVVALHSIGISDINEFANKLFNFWGIGKKNKNNGVLLLIVIDRHLWKIETGYGLEGVLPDIVCKRIGTGLLVPRFKAGKYGDGVLFAVGRIGLYIMGEATAESSNSEDSSVSEKRENGNLIVFIIFAFYMFVTVLGAFLIYRSFNKTIKKSDYSPTAYNQLIKYTKASSMCALIAGLLISGIILSVWLFITLRKLRNRPRISQKNGKPIYKLSEAEEDKFLSKGQILEEKLKSQDYDVWVTDNNDDVLVISYANAATHYHKCASCQCIADKLVKVVTVKKATTSHTGKDECSYRCLNCGIERTVLEITPIITYSSGSSGSGSSSSSGGSSFGGGSSGGGGASGSW